MKIGPIESGPIGTPTTERKGQAAPGPVVSEPSSQVALSHAAAVLASVSADPTFDAAKVERIAQAIRDGKFTIDADAIADKLIVNAQEVLSRRLT